MPLLPVNAPEKAGGHRQTIVICRTARRVPGGSQSEIRNPVTVREKT